MKRVLVFSLVLSGSSILLAQTATPPDSPAAGEVTCCQIKEPNMLEPMLGICTSLSNSGKMKSAGYNYIEAGVQSFLLPKESDEAWREKLKDMKKGLELPVYACNSFIPNDIKTTGPDAEPDKALAWAETAFRRAQITGVKFIVFGSGGSRKIPDGFSREAARAQFVALLKKMGPLAKPYGVTVVIEPLNTKETNFINSVSEGTDIAREVNHPNIQMLADFYHMLRENEGPESIIKAGKLLKHCHIAENKDRLAPGTNGEDFTPYFAALRQIGYQGGISIEGRWSNFDNDLPTALKTMQDQIAQVNQTVPLP